MYLDFSKETSKELDDNVVFNMDTYKSNDIKDLKNVHVKGDIHLNSAEILEINLTLTGSMYLNDSITLELIEYPFNIKIEEEYSLNDIYLEEYYKKEQNILDIMAILWENIVLEVPISLTYAKDVNLKGEGWQLGKNESKEDNIDPRLAKLAQILDERKE